MVSVLNIRRLGFWTYREALFLKLILIRIYVNSCVKLKLHLIRENMEYVQKVRKIVVLPFRGKKIAFYDLENHELNYAPIECFSEPWCLKYIEIDKDIHIFSRRAMYICDGV